MSKGKHVKRYCPLDDMVRVPIAYKICKNKTIRYKLVFCLPAKTIGNLNYEYSSIRKTSFCQIFFKSKNMDAKILEIFSDHTLFGIEFGINQ